MNANQSTAGSPSSGVLDASGHDRLAPLSPWRAKPKVHPIATELRRSSALYRAEAERRRQVRTLGLLGVTQMELELGQSTETNAGDAGVDSTTTVYPTAVEGGSGLLVAFATTITGLCVLLFALVKFGFPAMFSLSVVLSMLLLGN